MGVGLIALDADERIISDSLIRREINTKGQSKIHMLNVLAMGKITLASDNSYKLDKSYLSLLSRILRKRK
ncbi:Hypothetical predicted protein [Octopus vulgaris]|uniref:Uncharacterized protein n=1 Tax=Octopus vulgaris TaxID=6645 RepID=A0AA36AND6_OCTVU|nr:Hypothetical predicted protein [Octopus vulgaris]